MHEPVGSLTPRGTSTRLLDVLLILVALFLGQILLYHRSFGIKPASDDFPVVNEIVRGNANGPGVFFRESMSSMHHRPFKSLSIWAFAQISDQHREFWIRVLHFTGMACYLTVLGLWLRTLRLPLIACAIAATMMLFHPVLPQALASVDGVDGLMASAFLWLGAWLVLVWRDRFPLATLAATVCFVLAAGWKEYAFAMVPLATWTVLCFSEKHRWRRAGLLFGVLCAVFVAILFVRQRAMPAGYGTVRGADYASLNPIQWAINAAVIVSGLLFFGNSVWVFVHQNVAVLAMVGVCIAIAAATIGWGVLAEARGGEQTSQQDRRRWILFVLGSFVAASFPANIIFHVSEMYLSPLLLPLALITGIAVEGWRRQARPMRFIAAVVAIVALISSVFTIFVKVNGIRDVGQRAEDQMKQIIALLPPDAQGTKVAVLFDLNQLPPRRTYAVYRMGDEVLVVHSMALNWLAPEKNLYLGSFPLGRPDFRPAEFDYIFEWNPGMQRFERWDPATGQPAR